LATKSGTRNLKDKNIILNMLLSSLKTGINILSMTWAWVCMSGAVRVEKWALWQEQYLRTCQYDFLWKLIHPFVWVSLPWELWWCSIYLSEYDLSMRAVAVMYLPVWVWLKGTQAWNFFFDFFCINRNLMVPRACNTRFLKIVFNSAEIFDF
jgi:hypothetical protein